MLADQKYRNKDWLREEYNNKKRSCKDICEECNISSSTFYDWVEKFNLLRLCGPKSGKYEKDFLIKQYVENKKTLEEIEKEFNISQVKLRELFKKYKIIVKYNKKRITDILRKDINNIMDLYFIKNKSTMEIGKIYGFSDSAVRKILHEFGMKLRTVAEASRIFQTSHEYKIKRSALMQKIDRSEWKDFIKPENERARSSNLNKKFIKKVFAGYLKIFMFII